MGRQIFPADIAWIVEFTNEYADATRTAAEETDDPYVDVTTLENAPWGAEELPTRDLTWIADRLFEVFDAESAEQCTEHLDAMLGGARPVPRFVANDGEYMLTWEVESARAAVEAACALGLVGLLVGGVQEATPLGTCEADACVDVYVDRSRSRMRRYCSITCQNRTKVAAFRARRREAAAS
jgi:predicted RNA-binding Zn ribbon-like protein